MPELFTTHSLNYRGTFVMDKEGKVRHSSVNDLGIGRSVEECLRLVRAIQFNDKHGEGTSYYHIISFHPLSCFDFVISVPSGMERRGKSNQTQHKGTI